jgi:hypothetical protein
MRGREPNQTPLECCRGHRFLVTDDQTVWKNCSLRAVLSLKDSAHQAVYPGSIKKNTRAKKAVPLDRGPVLRFSQMIGKRRNIHVIC